MGHELPDLLGDKHEKVDDVLRRARELLAQLLLLGGHAHRTRVEMAHARHDASLGDHGDGAESEFLGSHHGGDGDVASGADAAVDTQDDAIAKAVGEEGGVGLAESHFPGHACVLDGAEGGGAGAAVAAGDLDDVGLGLGHAACYRANADGGDKLHGDAGLFVHGVEVVDELCQILNTVNIVMGRRADQRDALLTGPQRGNVLRNLGTGKLPPLPRLGALRHLNLQLLPRNQKLRRDPEASAGNLVHERVGAIPVLQSREVGKRGTASLLVDVRQVGPADDVLPSLSRVGFAPHAIHSDGEGLVGLAAQRPQAHCAGAEPRHDLGYGLDVLDGDGFAIGFEVEEVANVRERRRLEALLEDFVPGGVLGLDAVVLGHVPGGGGADLLVKSDRIVQELGEVGRVGVILSPLGYGLVVPVVDELGLLVRALGTHGRRLARNIR
mmetsp:Transcript_18787/g.45135  ORF Transcript_18787/g.45135 Transcript_18787/m.45135 type:complete len:440 (-) Transcript_18787:1966-3285(-)